MSRLRTIARRSFLIGSAAIVGGVAFGVWMAKKPIANPLEDDLAEGEASFNAWVRISADGITLITPHVDLGQGAGHLQAMLIAEEMDLEPGQYSTEFGPPSPAYWNTAMAGEALPFTTRDDGFIAEGARSVASALIKIYGLQMTGGSSTAADSYAKLRQAGAVARETLKAAASAQSGVPVADLRTEAGAVLLPDGAELAYTALAARAAEIEPVTDVTLRDPAGWRHVGKPGMRGDILAKSTGTQTYGIDLALDGMVHAAARLSPRRAALTAYDATEALAMRGVQAAIEVSRGVVVVADNSWRAKIAAESIACDWAAAPYPAEQAGHWAAVEAAFSDEHLDKTWIDAGDVASIGGDGVIEAEYRAGYAAHQPMEPLSAVVRVTSGGAEVWASHQAPQFVQTKVAEVLGIGSEQVSFHNQFAGGSFGHRLEWDNILAATEAAAQIPGVPVKLTLSREEDFASDYPRQIGMARARGRVGGGKVLAVDLAIATTSATASQVGRLGLAIPGPDAQIVSGVWNAPYALPDLRLRGYRVPELAPVSSWRSVGAVTAAFFAESFMDELIAAAGADPLAERLRISIDPRATAVLDKVGEMSGWGRDPGAGRGLGLALVESFGTMVAEVVEVEATDRGIRIHEVWVAAEVGRVLDPVNFENQVQGGVNWGLGHAMNCEITYADGMVEQTNFWTHDGLRMHAAPTIHVAALELGGTLRGIGEPPVPPAAPALANAIYAATGQRLRQMPFWNDIDFV